MPVIMGVLNRTALCAVLAFGVPELASAQAGDASAAAKTVTTTSAERVTQIDVEGLKRVLKPNGRPLLVNFWATWCEPCREEFPDLVKIDKEYRGKIDFVTVTLDDPDDIKTLVPKFLNEVKAEMPTYLLYTTDENAAITYVSKDWSGNLPMTVLYNASGSKAYERNGKVRYETLKPEIEKVLALQTSVVFKQIIELPLYRILRTEEDGIRDALRDLEDGKPQVFVYGLMPSIVYDGLESFKTRFKVGIRGSGCFVPIEGEPYAKAYNRTVVEKLAERHGKLFLEQAGFIPR